MWATISIILGWSLIKYIKTRKSTEWAIGSNCITLNFLWICLFSVTIIYLLLRWILLLIIKLSLKSKLSNNRSLIKTFHHVSNPKSKSKHLITSENCSIFISRIRTWTNLRSIMSSNWVVIWSITSWPLFFFFIIRSSLIAFINDILYWRSNYRLL